MNAPQASTLGKNSDPWISSDFGIKHVACLRKFVTTKSRDSSALLYFFGEGMDEAKLIGIKIPIATN